MMPRRPPSDDLGARIRSEAQVGLDRFETYLASQAAFEDYLRREGRAGVEGIPQAEAGDAGHAPGAE